MIYINGRFLTRRITGVERFALQLCLQLASMQLQWTILVPKTGEIDDAFSHLPVKAIGNKTGYFWEQVELPLWLYKNAKGSTLINLCNLAPLIYNNNVVALHDIAVLKYPQWYSKKFFLFYKLFLPLIVRRAAKLITVSAFSAKEISEYFNVDVRKIDVIYNGPTQLPKKTFDSNRWNFKKGEYILGVSSINERKNLKTLIDAFLELNTALHLVLAGEKNALFSGGLVIPESKKDKIHFLGYVSDGELFSLYTNGFVFVYPSLYEGFGIPPLEAMSCGCPVIVANTSSLPEVCKNGALYVNPTNTYELKEAILSLFNQNKRQHMIDSGYNVVNSYSWRNSAFKLVEVIKRSDRQN